MDFLPLMPNWMEIVSLSGGYVVASIEVGRRLSWYWKERRTFSCYDQSYQWGGWATAFFTMPVALTLIHSYANSNGEDGNGGWDKPPRTVRKQQRQKELEERTADLEAENKRLERKLELFLREES